MSFSLDAFDYFQAFDPRVKLSEKQSFVIEKGGSEVTVIGNTTSNVNNSQIVFSIIPPSNKTIIDRRFKVKVKFQLTFTGTDQGVPLLNLEDGTNAPRAFPLASICQGVSFKLNTDQFSSSPADWIHALVRFHTDENLYNTYYSMTPSMPDQSQKYSDLAGSSRNPLNGYEDSGFFTEGRGAFNQFIEVVSNTNTSAVINFTVVENVFMSPFLLGGEEGPGFIGITNMDLLLSLTDITRIWSSSDSGHTYTNLSVAVQQNPELLLTYITPKVTQNIPKSIAYNSNTIQQYSTTCGSRASGVSFNVTSNNIQLPQIPKLIYMFARRRNADRTYLTTDTYATLESVSIQFDNRTGILSTASSEELYRMSIDNGLKLSYNQWKNWVGSIACFRPTNDFGLNAGQSVSLYGSTYNLSVKATFKNISSETIDYDFYIITVVDGVMTISEQKVFQQTGILSESDVLNSENLPTVDPVALRNMYGGNFLDSIKSIGSKILGYVGKYGPKVLEYAPKAIEAAAKYGPMLAAGGGYSEEDMKPRQITGGMLLSKEGLGRKMRTRSRVASRF